MNTKQKLKNCLAMTVFLVSVLNIFAICPARTYVPPSKPHLEVSPPLIEYGPSPAVGQEFDINILIKNLLIEWQLVGIDFRLSYNNTLLEVVSVTEGPFLPSFPNTPTPPYTFFTYTVEPVPPNPPPPNIHVGEYLLPNATGQWNNFPHGDGVVTTIRFRILHQGFFPEVDTSPLNLYSITLIDSNSASIPYDPPLNGIVKIYGRYYRDIAITNVTASSTTVPRGEVINITVTVENQGDLTENFTLFITCGQTRNLTLAPKTSIITVFYLNTSKMTEGNYTLWALVPPCFGDDDPYDNIYIDGILEVISIIHDIAITKVTPSKTVVGQGYSLKIYVEVENQGNFIETFNVTVYADLNTTIIGDEITVGIQNVTLPSGNSTTLAFSWSTKGVAKGSYTITAEATQLPGEADTTDNTLIDGWVFITIPGDINGDQWVNILDAIILAGHFGHKNGDDHTPSTKEWQNCLNSDINGDNTVNILDAIILAGHFGEKWP